MLLMSACLLSCDSSSSTDNNTPTNDPKDDIIYGAVMNGIIGYHRGSDSQGNTTYDTVATCQMSYNVTGDDLKGSIKVTGRHFKWVDKISYNSGYFEGHTLYRKDSTWYYISGKDTSWRYSENLFGFASFDASINKADSIWFILGNDYAGGGFAKPDSLEMNVQR